MAYQERIYMGDGVELDSWDPQLKDFSDKTFNSYNRGPGQNLHCRKVGGQGITLYVQNLPDGLTEDGLRNIFVNCGDVRVANIRESRRPNSTCTYGFVELSSVREAEKAITQYNGFQIGPYRLKVQVALSQEEKEARALKKAADEDFLATLPSLQNTGSLHGSDSEGRSRQPLLNGYSTKKGRGRAERLEELTDTEMIEPTRPGRSMQHSYSIGPGGGSHYGLHNGGNFDPRIQHSGNMGYPGPYGYMDPHSNPHSMNYNPSRGRGGYLNNIGFQSHRFGGSPFGRGGSYGHGMGQTYGHHGYGDSYSSRDPRGFVPGLGRGQSFRAPGPGSYKGQDAYRGYESFRGNESFRSKSGYSTDTDRSVRGRETPIILRPCLHCHKEGKLQCARCKMPYCSKECQTADWDIHKKHCAELSQMERMPLDELEERFDVQVDDGFMENFNNAPGKKVNKKRDDSSSESSKHSRSGSRRNQDLTRGQGQSNGYHSSNDNKKRQGKSKSPQTYPPKKTGDSDRQTQNRGPPYQMEQVGTRGQYASSKTVERFHFKDLPTAELPLQTSLQVFITYVESPASIWVHLGIQENLQELENISLELSEQCEASTESVKAPMVGDVYAAQFEDGKWYRAKVTALQAPNSAFVFFYDYGNKAKITYDKLRHIDRKMIEFPVQAMQCMMGNVIPVGADWSKECVLELKKLLPEMDVCAFQADSRDEKGVYIGQFYQLENGECICDELLRNNLVMKTRRMMAADIPTAVERVKVGDELSLFIIGSETGAFYAQIRGDHLEKNFAEMMMSLHKSVQAQPSGYLPIVGEFVLARFSQDNNWYRAGVVDLRGHLVTVIFLDFGNKEETDISNIRQGDKSFAHVQIVSLSCCLAGVPSPWPAEVRNRIKALEEAGSPVSAIVKAKMGVIVSLELIGENFGKTQSFGSLTYNHGSTSQEVTSGKSSPGSRIGKSSPAAKTESMLLMTTGKSSPGPNTRAASPAMSKGEEVYFLSKMNLTPELSTKVTVDVRAVESPGCIYCQIADENALQAYEALFSNLQKFYRTAKQALGNPQVDQLAVVQVQIHEQDGPKWHRCVVLEKKSVAVRVRLLDAGLVEEVTVNDLRPIRHEFLELKSQAVKCALFGIAPLDTTWSDKSATYLRVIVGQRLLLVPRGRRNDTFLVHLCDQTDETCEAGALLAAENLVKAVSSPTSSSPQPPANTSSSPVERAGSSPVSSTGPPVLPTHLKKTTLPTDGTEVQAILSFLQDFDQVYVQIVPGAIELVKLGPELAASCEESEPITPGKGEMVCALFQGDWARARVDHVNPTNCRVYFVDYGNFDNVGFECVKRLSTKFCHLPIQAVHCSLEGVKIRGDKQELQRLQTMIKDTAFNVKCVEVKGDVHSVLIRVEDDIVNHHFMTAAPGQPTTEAVCEPVLMKSATLPTDGSPVQAVVVDIQGVSAVYVQTMDGHAAVLDLMEKLDASCQAQKETLTPTAGQMVAAMFQDNNWYRAKVGNVSPPFCTVVFVDFGNFDQVPFSKIKKLDTALQILPSQALRCELAGVDTDICEQKLMTLQHMQGKEIEVRVIGQVGDGYAVEIWLEGKSVNDNFRSGKEIASSQTKTREKTKSPALENLQPLKPASFPGDGQGVDCVLIHLEKFDVFYLQTLEGLETLLVMEEEMKEVCTKLEPFLPSVGDFVSAFFAPDDGWHRVRVDCVDETECTVSFLDYGNSASVPTSLIRRLDSQFRVYPCQAICCRLNGVGVQNDPNKVHELKQMLNEVKLTVFLVKSGNINLVDIFIDSKKVNDHFSKLEVTRPEQAPCSGPVVLQPTELPLNTLVVAAASHIEGLDKIYIQTEDTTEHLQPLQNLLNECCSFSLDTVVPAVGDFVAACFKDDKKWYRAQVTAVDANSCTALFVDYGNSDEVPFADVKKLPAESTKHPVLAICCALADVRVEQNHENLFKLAESIAGKPLNVKAVGKNSATTFVEISVGDVIVNNIFQPAAVNNLDKPAAVHDNQLAQECQDVAIKFAELTCDGSSIEVVAVHVEEFDNIFVQTVEGFMALQDLMTELNVHCTNVQTAPGQSTPGSLVCAFCCRDNSWFRARVEEVIGDKVQVHYLDFGDSEIVDAANIKVLDPKFCSVPFQGIKCALYGVDVREDSEKLALLQGKVNGVKSTVKVISKSDGVYSVEMKVEDEVINKLFLRTPSQASLPTDGSIVDVIMTDVKDFNTIFVQTCEGALKVETMQNDFKESCENKSESVLPSCGDLVAAYFSDINWYRGQVKDLTPTHCNIFFIDYGNTDLVELGKIRAIDRQFCTLPFQAIQCSLAGVECEATKEELDKLREHINDKLLKVRAISVTDGIYKVEMTAEEVNINSLFQSQEASATVAEEEDEAELIRRQIEELQLKLASKMKK